MLDTIEIKKYRRKQRITLGCAVLINLTATLFLMSAMFYLVSR